jgi:gliding motility-associated lipoprotein GldB
VLIFLFAAIACKRNPLKVDISKSKNEIEVVRFDKELFSADTTDLQNSITVLSNKYPEFFNLFTYKIIHIGGFNNEHFLNYLMQFLTDTMIVNVNKMVEKEFADFDKTKKELNRAFKYFQYHFPEKKLPTVYAYVSGFNQSIVTAENLIGISLDKYLGKDCPYYLQLTHTPMYKITTMYKEKIPSDVAYAWGITEFGNDKKATTVLDNMVYQGKMMYFVDALLPGEEDSVKIGYTSKQINWCRNNEAEMWNQLIELKMLYSSKRMDIIRYTNPSPTTSGFTLESPGRTGVWLGWQIVRKYMDKFPETTLEALMNNSNYQQILNDSEYFPK